MHDTQAKLIAEDRDGRSTRDLAAALKKLVFKALDAGKYQDLFLRKKTVELLLDGNDTDDIAALVNCGLIVLDEDKHCVRSNVMIHYNPHTKLTTSSISALLGESRILIATDWPDIPPLPARDGEGTTFDGRKMVFPLHYESFLVIEHLHESILDTGSPKQVLDIFCGSGVLGIYAAAFGCELVTFSDRHRRALAFAKLNAAMNEIDSARFLRSDCFEDIPGDSEFDLILANPPFEAVSEADKDKYFCHSAAGEDGQEFMRRFLKQKHRFLASTGKTISVDFMISDAEAMNMPAQLERFFCECIEDPQASGVLHVYDTLALREFWARFDVLGIDTHHKVLDKNLNGGNAYLSLCVLETSRTDSHTQITSVSHPDRRPPVPWWNPVSWPLPCGLSQEPENIRCWVHHWQVHELEHRAEQLAARAESLVSDEPQNQGVSFWDPNDILNDEHPNYDSPQGRTVQEALFTLARDTESILLANTAGCESAEILLLPEKSHADGLVWSISSPHILFLQDELQRLRILNPNEDERTLFLAIARDNIARIHTADLKTRIDAVVKDMSHVLLVFSIKNPMLNPEIQIRSLRELETFLHTFCDAFLVWHNHKYQVGQSRIALDSASEEAWRYSCDEVQRYIVLLTLSGGSLEALDQYEAILRGIDEDCRWQNVVLLQLYRFLRDRLGFLAISALLSDIVGKRVKDVELLNIKQRVFSFLSHNLNNLATGIPIGATPHLIKRHMAVAILTIEAARYFGDPPLGGRTYAWNSVDLSCIEGESIREVLEAVCSGSGRDVFTLEVDDSPLAARMGARVDPRFVAILVELAMNLKKRSRFSRTGSIAIRREGHGFVSLSLSTSGVAEHGFQYYDKLLAEKRASPYVAKLQLRGVALVARLARELNTYLDVTINYVQRPLALGDDPDMYDESEEGGWRIRLPRSMSCKNEYLSLSTEPVSIEITVGKIPVDFGMG